MVRSTRRRLATLLGGAALAIALAVVVVTTIGADTAPADGGNTVAVAVNTKDGTTTFKVRLQIRRENGTVVDSLNAAVAASSCTDCRSIAAAFQVVLVTNAATEIAPTNLALALNEGCEGCETLASAYQFVFGRDGQVRFTDAGRDEIHAIRKALKRLRDDDLSTEEIQRRLDDLATRLAAVLTSELTVGDEQLVSVPSPDPATSDESAPCSGGAALPDPATAEGATAAGEPAPCVHDPSTTTSSTTTTTTASTTTTAPPERSPTSTTTTTDPPTTTTTTTTLPASPAG